MFKSCYQGGTHVEIFSAQGKDPAAKWSQSGKVQRIFDKVVKSYVYMLEGGPSTKMQVPKDERQGLCLTQQFVVLQLSVPLGVGFNVQILASDTLNNKRRIFLSSAHRDISHTPLHTRLPLGMMTRGQWVNLAINVSSIVSGVFTSTFKSIELICISASCKLRKVFTMRHQPHNTTAGLYSPSYDGPTETIPKACTLNVGTATQVVDMAVIRQWVENQQPKIQRDAVTKSAPQNPLLRARPAPRNAHSAEHQRKVQNSLESATKQKTPVPKTQRATKQQRLQQQSAAARAELTSSRDMTSSQDGDTREGSVTSRVGSVTSRVGLREGTLVINRQLGNFVEKNSTPTQSRSESDFTSTQETIKHSTPTALMDRVLDVSFDTIQSRVNLISPTNINNNSTNINNSSGHEDHHNNNNNFTDFNSEFALNNEASHLGNGRVNYDQDDGKMRHENNNVSRDMINDISEGNITFRSSSSSQQSTPARSHRTTRVTARRSRDHHNSEPKVYNSKEYEDDNPFAASDEDLKYRMKALALYNGELDESFDMSITSRKSRRSHGVGPGTSNQSDDEIEEKLGEDTDTSSSDATVLSHAQEVLLSGSVGHTSFLQDSIGKNYENRLTDRAYSPPICYPDELTRQATLPQHTTTNTTSTIEEDSGEEELDLLYDPVLNCYFDPKTCKYYELA